MNRCQSCSAIGSALTLPSGTVGVDGAGPVCWITDQRSFDEAWNNRRSSSVGEESDLEPLGVVFHFPLTSQQSDWSLMSFSIGPKTSLVTHSLIPDKSHQSGVGVSLFLRHITARDAHPEVTAVMLRASQQSSLGHSSVTKGDPHPNGTAGSAFFLGIIRTPSFLELNILNSSQVFQLSEECSPSTS